MLDLDTFVITLYVLVDDFCRDHLPAPRPRPGRRPRLCPGEVLTLALVAQWARFSSERDFWRFATCRLTHLFPTLPHLSQFNRLQQTHSTALAALCHHLVQRLEAKNCPFEAIDRCGIATRWCGRRGVGWLSETTNKGYCSRLGYFHGYHLLSCINPEGVITGFGLGPASAKDQPLAEAFFQARALAGAGLGMRGMDSVGLPCRSGDYVADRGFNGNKLHQHWRECYGVRVIHPDKGYRRAWLRWLAGLRQIVETVHDDLLNTFRLARERPHELGAFVARLRAKVCLHNFCIWLNCSLGRKSLAFADLIQW